MIIKKIAAICKSRKSVALFDDEEADVQWISDGCAVYPLYDMPPLDDETVLVVLDVPGDKRGDYRVKHEALPAVYNFRDDDDLERMLPEPDVLADRLRMLASEMETTLHYKTLEEEEAEDDTQLRIDEETGEVIE